MSNIFDIPISIVQTYTTRYRASVILCLILDGILSVVCGVLLMYRGDIFTLIELAIIIAVLINFIILRVSVKSEYNNVFRLYLKYKNTDVGIRAYKLSEQELYSVLSSMGVSGKAGKTFELYTEILNHRCIRSTKQAKKFIRLLKPFESEDGNFRVYVMKRTNMYIGVVEEEKKDECDY